MTKDTLAEVRDQQLTEVRATLEEQRAELAAELDRLTAPDDDPTASFTNEALAASTRQALEDTDRALRALADGSFGVCSVCGDDIPLERLQVRPTSRNCVPCQQKLAA